MCECKNKRFVSEVWSAEYFVTQSQHLLSGPILVSDNDALFPVQITLLTNLTSSTPVGATNTIAEYPICQVLSCCKMQML